jgi:hypothetical protein
LFKKKKKRKEKENLNPETERKGHMVMVADTEVIQP